MVTPVKAIRLRVGVTKQCSELVRIKLGSYVGMEKVPILNSTFESTFFFNPKIDRTNFISYVRGSYSPYSHFM